MAVFFLRSFIVLIALVFVSGCGFVPGSGPQSGDFTRRAQFHRTAIQSVPNYVLIDVDQDVVEALRSGYQSGFAPDFGPRKGYFPEHIQSGDLIELAVFEAQKGGLFVDEDAIMPQGNFITVPEQRVPPQGYIKVPYVGKVKAGGKTTLQVAKFVEDKLKKRALEPQVIVSVKERPGQKITVTGQVRVGGRFDIPPDGLRILDAVGLAKGADTSDYHVRLTLQRNGRAHATMMSTLVNDPKSNILMEPGDILSVDTRKRYFSVLGAATVQARYAFQSEYTSVMDGLAQAHGLFDDKANPRSVVLFRHMAKTVVQDLGVVMHEDMHPSGVVPTVMRFDFKDPRSFFLASEIEMQDGDVLFVANSPLYVMKKVNFYLRDPAYTQAAGADAIFYSIRARNALSRLPGYQ